MKTPVPEDAWTEEPAAYSVPRLKAVASPTLEQLQASVGVKSLSGEAQLDFRVLPTKSGATRSAFVPKVAAHVLHLEPGTSSPAGRDRNGLLQKGVDGHILSSTGVGLAFLSNARSAITLSSAVLSGDGEDAQAPTVAEAFMVWEKFEPPVPLSEALQQTSPKSLVMPFVDVVAAERVQMPPRRMLAGVKSASCVRLIMEADNGRRQAALLRTTDPAYGDPAFFVFHRFMSELLALQRQLKDRVTADVRTQYGGVGVTDEARAELQSEIDDTWLLWRQENDMVDGEVFGTFARNELATYFADMAPVLPYYWRVPVVRAALDGECQGIPNALPPVAGIGEA